MNKDISRIIDRLNKKKADLETTTVTKMRKLLVELHAIGCDVAKARFREVEAEHIVVDEEPIWEGNTVILKASGEDILFIEFGTGVTYTPTQYGEQYGFGPATYSRQNAHFLEHGDWWVYEGEKNPWSWQATRTLKDGTTKERPGKWMTKGAPAADAMYEASKEMRFKVSLLLEKYFK